MITLSRRTRSIQMTIWLAVALLLQAPTFAQSKVLSDTPPAHFGTSLSALDSPFESVRKEALARFAANRDWEPYLRSTLNSSTDRKTRSNLRKILIELQGELFDRNLVRAKTWADELRLDYLADLARCTDDPKQAAVLADLVITAQKT